MKSFLACVGFLVVFVFVSGMAYAQQFQIKSDTLNFPVYQIPPKAVNSSTAVKPVSVQRLPFQRDYPPQRKITKVQKYSYNCVYYYPAQQQQAYAYYPQQQSYLYSQPPFTPVCIGVVAGVLKCPFDLLSVLFGG
jgi:hypothetical protein